MQELCSGWSEFRSLLVAVVVVVAGARADSEEEGINKNYGSALECALTSFIFAMSSSSRPGQMLKSPGSWSNSHTHGRPGALRRPREDRPLNAYCRP